MLNKITDNVEIHQTLPDTPNITTQELKKEWDKGCKIIKEAFNSLVDELNNNMFPIGFRMYVNNDKDYSNHLGFTWQKVAKGRVLVGKDENDEDFNAVGKKGGEKTNTHFHYGTISNDGENVYVSTSDSNRSLVERREGKVIASGGNEVITLRRDGTDDAKINIMQPYEVVNIWERIL